jgi:hypothetical protein
MFGEWEVKIVDSIVRMGYYIYLTKRTKEGRVFISNNGEMIHTLTGEQIDKNEEEISFAFLEPDQLKALAEGISAAGVKTQSDFKNEGLLQATNKHLEDMRSLVFKKGNK